MPNLNEQLYLLELKTDYSELRDYRKDINMLEIQGQAISSAKKLAGEWIVYKDGKLVKKDDQKVRKNIKSLDATLDVESNLSGLVVLDRVVTGEIEHNQDRPVPHIHFSNGNIEFIKAKKGEYRLGYAELHYKRRFWMQRK